jgi:FlaG/FlaF family flagellin (archaellin)
MGQIRSASAQVGQQQMCLQGRKATVFLSSIQTMHLSFSSIAVEEWKSKLSGSESGKSERGSKKRRSRRRRTNLLVLGFAFL